MAAILGRAGTTKESASVFKKHAPGFAPAIVKGLQLEPLSPCIGAEIRGIDLRQELSADLVADLRAALVAHKVIFFRDQDIGAEEHLRFARYFGDLEIHPVTPADQENREILRLVHNAEHPGRENNWHSDVTWRAEPSMGSVLRAIKLPQTGGDTLFANMAAAFQGLPESIRAFISGLTAEHEILRAFASRIKPEKHEETRQKYPPQIHPVVRTHPESGEQAIYVNIAFTTRIMELDRVSGEQMLSYLQQQAWVPEYQCRFRWEPGSIAFWDNRAAQHYAVSDYWPLERVMERVTVAGDRPFYKSDLN